MPKISKAVLDAETELDYLDPYTKDGIEFAYRVLDKKDRRIIGGPLVRKACRRFISDLKKWKDDPTYPYYFDIKAAEHACQYFEKVLIIPVGQTGEIPFKLFGWHKFVLYNVFGWKRKLDNALRFKKVYMETGRGTAKSSLATGIAMYVLFLLFGKKERLQGYLMATTDEQAGMAFGMADSQGESERFQNFHRKRNEMITVRAPGASSWLVENKITKSFFRRLPGNKTGKGRAGANAQIAILEEYGDFETEAAKNSFVEGMRSNISPLLIIPTNAGVENTVCEKEHKLAEEAMNEKDPDEEYFAFIGSIDKGDKPFKDPHCWQKAIPGLGVSATIDHVISRVKDALKDSFAYSRVARYQFGIWQALEEVQVLFRANEIDPCILPRDEFDNLFTPEVLRECPMHLSIDLAFIHDLCTMGMMWDVSGVEGSKWNWATKFKSWKPARTIISDEEERHIPYQEWIDDGDLVTPGGNYVDLRDMASDIFDLYYEWRKLLRLVVYDRYKIMHLFKDAEAIQLPLKQFGKAGRGVPVLQHEQTGKQGDTSEDVVEKVKKGQINCLYMPRSIDECRNFVLEQKVAIRQSKPFRHSALATQVRIETSGSKTVHKAQDFFVIDPSVCFIMLCGAALAGDKKRHKPNEVFHAPNFDKLQEMYDKTIEAQYA